MLEEINRGEPSQNICQTCHLISLGRTELQNTNNCFSVKQGLTQNLILEI